MMKRRNGRKTEEVKKLSGEIGATNERSVATQICSCCGKSLSRCTFLPFRVPFQKGSSLFLPTCRQVFHSCSNPIAFSFAVLNIQVGIILLRSKPSSFTPQESRRAREKELFFTPDLELIDF